MRLQSLCILLLCISIVPFIASICPCYDLHSYESKTTKILSSKRWWNWIIISGIPVLGQIIINLIHVNLLYSLMECIIVAIVAIAATLIAYLASDFDIGKKCKSISKNDNKEEALLIIEKELKTLNKPYTIVVSILCIMSLLSFIGGIVILSNIYNRSNIVKTYECSINEDSGRIYTEDNRQIDISFDECNTYGSNGESSAVYVNIYKYFGIIAVTRDDFIKDYPIYYDELIR